MEVSTNLVCMFVGFPSYAKHTPYIVNLKHASYAQFNNMHDPNDFGNIK
jgi:hypothetical protein